MRRSRARRVGHAVLIASLLTCCTSSPNSPARTPAATASSPAASPTTAASPVDVAAVLEAPPQCPGPPPKPEVVSSNYGPLIGHRPLWAGLYASRDHDGRYHAPDAPRTDAGWRIKVLWVMDPHRSTPVTASGAEATTGDVVLFQVGGEDAAVTDVGTFDPIGAQMGDGGWREFPSFVLFPRAGCFVLHASWRGGGWDLTLSFGR